MKDTGALLVLVAPPSSGLARWDCNIYVVSWHCSRARLVPLARRVAGCIADRRTCADGRSLRLGWGSIPSL
jgi:hypothetical protein